MKLTNLLAVLGMAGVCLLGPTLLCAQTFQPGDFVVDGYAWYHADGTFVKVLGPPCDGCTAGVFDLQGKYWQLIVWQQITYVANYDLSGNLVSYFQATAGYPPIAAQGIFLDAKGHIYVVGTTYTNQYLGGVWEYDASGKNLGLWTTHDLGGNPAAWPQKGDLTRDQKTAYLDGVFALALKKDTIKGFACGDNTWGYSEIRILPDGSYLANNGPAGTTGEVDHCTATGKLIRAYPIPQLPGLNNEILGGLAVQPDAQSFLVGETGYGGTEIYGAIESVDFATGTVTPVWQSLNSPSGYLADIAIFGAVGVANCPLSLPATVTFPSQTVHTTSNPLTVKVTNIGTSPVPIGSITITGADPGDFAETDNCSNTNLGIGKRCSVNVTFTPGATGKRSATLDVANSPGSAICSPVTTSLKGTGTP